jgi:hypothetical protein
MSLVTVATFPQIHLAEVAKAHLEAAGIESQLVDEGVVGANPFLSVAVGGVKIQVREEDAKRAAELIEELEQTESPDNTCLACGKPMGEDEDKCSACGWSFLSEG